MILKKSNFIFINNILRLFLISEQVETKVDVDELTNRDDTWNILMKKWNLGEEYVNNMCFFFC